MSQDRSIGMAPGGTIAPQSIGSMRDTGSVIVGIDGRPQDADAIVLARLLAGWTGGKLICAHVVSNVVGGRGMVQYEMSLECEARERLVAVARQLGAQPELLHGVDHADALARLAERRSASMLVLGSTHREEVGRVVPGGVASHLLTHAPCGIAVAPVGYAQRSSTPVKIIGVAYDGTSESISAAERAASFAKRAGARLRLYHAFHEVPVGVSWDAFRGHMRVFAQEIVDRGLDRLDTEVRADGRALQGPPGVAIAHAAEVDDVDFLFVGSRGYGPLREALVGGFVGSLLAKVSCPLVILPRPAVRRKAR